MPFQCEGVTTESSFFTFTKLPRHNTPPKLSHITAESLGSWLVKFWCLTTLEFVSSTHHTHTFNIDLIYYSKLAGKSSLQIADQSLVTILTRDSPTDSVRPVFSDLKPLPSNSATPPYALHTPHGTVPAGLDHMVSSDPPKRNELSALG